MKSEQLDDSLGAIGQRLEKIDAGVDRVFEGVTRLHTAVADTRHDLGVLSEKLVRIQEAIYFMAHSLLAPEQSEELRSMLPDSPKRRLSFSSR